MQPIVPCKPTIVFFPSLAIVRCVGSFYFSLLFFPNYGIRWEKNRCALKLARKACSNGGIFKCSNFGVERPLRIPLTAYFNLQLANKRVWVIIRKNWWLYAEQVLLYLTRLWQRRTTYCQRRLTRPYTLQQSIEMQVVGTVIAFRLKESFGLLVIHFKLVMMRSSLFLLFASFNGLTTFSKTC